MEKELEKNGLNWDLPLHLIASILGTPIRVRALRRSLNLILHALLIMAPGYPSSLRGNILGQYEDVCNFV